MLVSPISQTNNNTSFQSLNKIKYAGLFNPQKVSEQAEAVKAFKNSDAFKKFFDKFNGSATFSDSSSLNDWHKLNLSFTYKKAGEKESGVKKVFRAIKNIFSPNKNKMLPQLNNRNIEDKDIDIVIIFVNFCGCFSLEGINSKYANP